MDEKTINNVETVMNDIPVEEVVRTMPNVGKYIVKGGFVVGVTALAAVVIKNVYDSVKANKELRQPEEEIVVEPEQVEEVAAK